MKNNDLRYAAFAFCFMIFSIFFNFFSIGRERSSISASSYARHAPARSSTAASASAFWQNTFATYA